MSQAMTPPATVPFEIPADVSSLTWCLQALLVRHEAYVADSEQERAKLTAVVSELEGTTRNLEAQNAELIAENKSLSEEVEGLTGALADSDAQLQGLTATLQSSQLEMQRLSALANRTRQCEKQLEQLESDQAQLQEKLAITDEDRRVASAQWAECQRTIAGLEVQLETIEREAREERQRHSEVVDRMKRTRAVEKELESAAGRLKGAAASKLGEKRQTSNVVSSFVKEILEDNAKLQLSIVELQDTLTLSKEEIERLRMQLSFSDASPPSSVSTAFAPTLQQELGSNEPARSASQEVHVHHHYHTSTAPSRNDARPRSFIAQRQKGRRSTSGRATPLVTTRSPTRYSADSRIFDASSATDEPVQRPSRWSVQTGSSFATSGSHSPTSTVFELPFNAESSELSQPTTPASSVWSPTLHPTRRKDSTDDISLSSPPHYPPVDLLGATSPMNMIPEILHESNSSFESDAAETDGVLQGSNSLENSTTLTERPMPSTCDPPRTTFLRRTNSTDSLLSISGMDIHSSTPQPRSRPSHLTALRTSDRQNSGPVLTATIASAMRSPSRKANSQSNNAHHVLRSSLGTDQKSSYAPLQDTLGKKFGGWFSGRWMGGGGGTTASTGDLKRRAVSDNAVARVGIKDDAKAADDIADSQSRRTNAAAVEKQDESATPTRIRTGRVLVTAALDEEALKECLEVDE